MLIIAGILVLARIGDRGVLRARGNWAQRVKVARRRLIIWMTTGAMRAPIRRRMVIMCIGSIAVIVPVLLMHLCTRSSDRRITLCAPHQLKLVLGTISALSLFLEVILEKFNVCTTIAQVILSIGELCELHSLHKLIPITLFNGLRVEYRCNG